LLLLAIRVEDSETKLLMPRVDRPAARAELTEAGTIEALG
jgi:hypothetical protein